MISLALESKPLNAVLKTRVVNGDKGVMKSGVDYLESKFTPLHGLKQRPTQRDVGPCWSVLFDKIQFWSGNVSALKTDPRISSKVSVFSKCLKKRCHRSLGRNKISIH